MNRPSFPARTLVVIPALNEADCVRPTVLSWLRLGFQRIRVVDNGSTDSTAAVARELGAEVVTEPQRGYGAAAWRGVHESPADCEYVLFSSADGSDRLDPSDLAAWQTAIDLGADLVLGDRTARAEARQHLKLIQRWGNWVQCTGIALGWGRRFRDMGSLRLIRRSALTRLRLRDRGFGWNIEMQVRVLELKLHCVELPVGYFPRAAGVSKISGNFVGSWRAGRGILQMLLQLAWLRRHPLAQFPGESNGQAITPTGPVQ